MMFKMLENRGETARVAEKMQKLISDRIRSTQSESEDA